MKYNKTAILILLSFLFSLSINCSSSKKDKRTGVKKWTYFKIYADADDAPIFVKLQDDLNIDPKLERYSIVVDKEIKTQITGILYLVMKKAHISQGLAGQSCLMMYRKV